MAYLELPDGVPLYYEDTGTGPAVILLHGWTMNSTFFQANTGPLAQANRVVTVDFRGHGNSGKTDAGHSLHQYAHDVRALIDHLDLDDVCLVGWSMGTAVILSYIREYGTEKLRSVSFVDQSPRFLDAAEWDFPLMGSYSITDLAVFAQTVRHSRPTVIKPFIASCFAEEPDQATTDAIYAETTKTHTRSALDIWFDMAYADFRPMLHEVSVPALLVYGEHSKVFPGDLGGWLAEQLPNAEVARFDNSGHAPFAEEPERFNTVLGDFLASS
ncbi:alpha/beta fold hydrolase [Allokutzneria oryzae]|uniref:Alpha/beta fold hydrolase n=1 Tax=Allokutzneria oryzae TaxID=1378989 RepID=A0ABV5ZT73_9PSEU